MKTKLRKMLLSSLSGVAVFVALQAVPFTFQPFWIGEKTMPDVLRNKLK